MARQFPRWIAPVVLCLAALTAGAATIHNDASCDIGVAPAATLLLPYFEVDLDDASGEATIFTITNVRNVDRVARVTLWTDYAVPVFTFNVFLTGYDVQSISLHDVLARGITPGRPTERGAYSRRARRLDPSDCDRGGAPLADEYLARIQQAFLEGRMAAGGGGGECDNVGNEHDNAVGYATVDVVANCSANTPDMPAYWSEDLRWDNVLVGDYQQVHAASRFAQGSPMVHIRAVPEGGAAGIRTGVEVPFERTFYALYQSAAEPRRDARQPLPSVFAARWIQHGFYGHRTWMKIWRQGKTHTTTCKAHDETGSLQYVEVVRFDEQENAVSDAPPPCRLCTACIDPVRTLPATSRVSVGDASVFPYLQNGAVAGWVYLNLDNCNLDAWGSQNWVVTSMQSDGRYSTDGDAAALGNGCSAPAKESEIRIPKGEIIGPRP